MKTITEIIGNMHDPQWKQRLQELEVTYLMLDQWTAQKSRFLLTTDRGEEIPVALTRHAQITDGDIILYNPAEKRAIVLRLELNPVLVIDLGNLQQRSAEEIIRRSVELGHALGNQHWPAVVKGTKVFVPLTVDKKVMQSVMDTHHFEDVSYEFCTGQEVIPYLAPHEVRRLFGGVGQSGHIHQH
ncbi:MAG: urease accessory protein UreE [Bacteroides sp.]|nr:urease accessory protein UreE [Bacteroides sp.]